MIFGKGKTFDLSTRTRGPTRGLDLGVLTPRFLRPPLELLEIVPVRDLVDFLLQLVLIDLEELDGRHERGLEAERGRILAAIGRDLELERGAIRAEAEGDGA